MNSENYSWKLQKFLIFFKPGSQDRYFYLEKIQFNKLYRKIDAFFYSIRNCSMLLKKLSCQTAKNKEFQVNGFKYWKGLNKKIRVELFSMEQEANTKIVI